MNIEEVVTIKPVAAPAGRRRFRLRPTRTGCIQVSLNRSEAYFGQMEKLDPQVRDVYAEFGLAMAVAQSLERQLVFLIIAAYERPSGKLTADAYNGLLGQLSQQTLGILVQRLRDSFDVPTDFDQPLQETLRLRNWLTHHYFADRTAEFQSSEGRSEMIRELDKISYRLNELDEYFDHLLVNWLVDPSMRPSKLIIEAVREMREEV